MNLVPIRGSYVPELDAGWRTPPVPKTCASCRRIAARSFAWIWLAFLCPALGQAPPAREITSFQSFYNLPREEAAKGRPIRLKGVVLCYDQDWRQLYIHDGRDAGYFDPGQFKTQPQVGQMVEITGATSVTENNSTFANPNLTVLGRGKVPAAKRLKLPQLASDYGQWIETRGWVRVAETSRGRLALVLHNQGQSCLVYLMGEPKTQDFKRLVGSKVQIRGINASKAVKGRIQSAQIMAPDFAEITVVEKGDPGAESLPVVPIGNLLSEPGRWTNNRVHINGLISSYRAGQDMIVKDPTGAIRAQLVQVTPAQPDDRVDVWGFPSVSGADTILQDAYFEVTLPQLATSARPVTQGPVPETTNLPSLLTQVSEIRKLRKAEAARHIPVRLRGVVTYADPHWRNSFIQDQSGGIYVDLARKDIRPGHWVELTGHTGPGGFMPEVLNSSFLILGTTNLPTAAKVDLQDLVNGHLDSYWLEMKGVVRRMNDQGDHTSLELMSRKGKFKALLPNPGGQPVPAHLIDSVVTVQGACGSQLNAQGQLSGIILHVPSLDQIAILEQSPADPFAVETTPISSVATFHVRPGSPGGPAN